MKESKCLLLLFLVYILLTFLSYLEVGKTFKYNNYIERYDYYCEQIENENDKSCDADIKELKKTPDKLTVFYSIMQSEYFYNLPIIAPILLIVFSMYYINKIFKSKYLYYYVQRKSYYKFIRLILFKSYKFAFIAPILITIIYLLSLTISTHNSTFLVELFNTSTFHKIHYNTDFFVILYANNIFILWLSLINIGLIIQSKNRNYIFNVIEFIIIYFVLEMLIENLPSYFWMFSIYGLSNYSIYYQLMASVLYFIISFIIVIFVYRKKEMILKRIGG